MRTLSICVDGITVSTFEVFVNHGNSPASYSLDGPGFWTEVTGVATVSTFDIDTHAASGTTVSTKGLVTERHNKRIINQNMIMMG